MIGYILTVGLVAFLNGREFRRCPEKAQRHKALPMGYKLACWLGVAPQVAALPIYPWLTISGMVSYALLEGACVRWYQKSGYIGASSR
ncbi:MAG: hypothetical protein ABIR54_04560 [Burkholderiaceae bacterium]